MNRYSRLDRLLLCVTLGLTVSAAAAAQSRVAGGRTRTYYMAADNVVWDYVPGGQDEIHDAPFVDSAFFRQGPPQVKATTYQKVLYREYSDSTFQTLRTRPAEWRHLGFLGPILHAEVGDTIRIVFRNNGNRPYSVHPHGVLYKKDSEGAGYVDGTSAADKVDDGVPPAGTHVYVWPVTERAGPGPGDPTSVMWMYHSHVDETRDVNTGLLGVMIVTAQGKAKPDGSPKDVDREIVASFDQVHEEDSWLADQNITGPTFGPQSPVPNRSERQNFYPYFVKFSINGFTRGTLPLTDVTIKKGQRVRWYLMSSTNDFDFHTPHWHGNVVMAGHMRTDVVSMAQMEMLVADMVPDNPGTWLFHCHVSFHNSAGMAMRYRVLD